MKTTLQTVLEHRWKSRYAARMQAPTEPRTNIHLTVGVIHELYRRGHCERYKQPSDEGPRGETHAPGSSNWDESKHPRAADGKFGSGGVSATGGTEKSDWEHELNVKGSATSGNVTARIIPMPSMTGAWQAEVEINGKVHTIAPRKEEGFGWRQAKADAIKALEDAKPAGPKEQKTMFEGITPKPLTPPDPTKNPVETQGTLFDEKELAGGLLARNKEGELEVSGTGWLHKNEDGRKVGMALVGVDDLTADPSKFQYKFSEVKDVKAGVTEELKEVKQYNPLYGGQLLVWHDTNDGKTYVVNGHHRYELAKRSNYTGPLNVYHIEANSIEEAKAIGALTNIAEGKGTAIDAANFMRETGRTMGDLTDSGISLKGSVARDAQHLVKASNKLWTEVKYGWLPQDKALIITKALGDEPAAQDKILKRLDVRSGKRLMGNAILQEAVDTMLASPKVKSDSGDTGPVLFKTDEDEERLWEQRATAAAHFKEKLVDEKMTWRNISKEGRAQRAEEAGNVINVEENKERAMAAAAAEDYFNRLKNKKGPLAEVLNNAAQRLFEHPRQAKRILKEAWDEALAAIREDLGQGLEEADKPSGEPPTAAGESGAGGPGASTQQLATAAEPAKFARRHWAESLAREFDNRLRYAAPQFTAVAEMDDRTPQVNVNYRSAFGGARCATCTHFRKGSNRCAEVEGEIRASDVCDLWKP